MHIGIDGRVAGTVGGIGRYARELISAVVAHDRRHAYSVFVYDDQPKEWIPSSATVVGLDRRHKKKLPFIWEHWLLSKDIERHGIDLMHFPNPTAPLGFRGPFVATVHDLSIYRHPEWFAPNQFVSTRWTVPRTFERAKKLIVVSAAVKEEARRQFGVAEERMVVIPNGVNTGVFHPVPDDQSEATLKKYGIETPYLLFVGKPAPYKNLQLIVEIAQRSDYRVVVVGPSGRPDLPVKEWHDIDNVVFTGELSPDSPELVHLYSRAFLLLQPSLYESFGLPVMEAMACSTPAVVADIPSLRDIYHETVVYAHPKKPDEWLRAITLLEDRAVREKLVHSGKYAVEAHSWERVAEATVRVYEHAVT